MLSTKNSKLANKCKDFYNYLVFEYILKHTFPVNNESCDLQKAQITPDLINERRLFTARLMKLQQNLVTHVFDLGLLADRLPLHATLKKMYILFDHLDVVYLKLVENLECFKKKSSKRRKLRKKIEAKILEVVETMQNFGIVPDDTGRKVKIYRERSCCDLFEECCNYVDMLHGLLYVFSKEIVEYIQELMKARKNKRTTRQKMCSWFRTRWPAATGKYSNE